MPTVDLTLQVVPLLAAELDALCEARAKEAASAVSEGKAATDGKDEKASVSVPAGNPLVLSTVFHRHGVNMRLLFLVRAHARSPAMQALLLQEMVPTRVRLLLAISVRCACVVRLCAR